MRLPMILTAAALSVLTVACSSETPPGETPPGEIPTDAAASVAGDADAAAGESAVAPLRSADGKDMGTATATAVDGGVMITLAATGLPEGVHGAHVHMVGKCEAPKFESAGGHWNPGDTMHGTMNGPGHAGDLANLTVAADGTGKLEPRTPSGTFAEMLDTDGAAFVIHAGPDDMKTDPSGNSGDRIACGVFARS